MSSTDTAVKVYGPLPKPEPSVVANYFPSVPSPPPSDMEMPFGRHKGEAISAIPRAYLKTIRKTHSHRLTYLPVLKAAIKYWKDEPLRDEASG